MHTWKQNAAPAGIVGVAVSADKTEEDVPAWRRLLEKILKPRVVVVQVGDNTGSRHKYYLWLKARGVTIRYDKALTSPALRVPIQRTSCTIFATDGRGREIPLLLSKPSSANAHTTSYIPRLEHAL